MIDDLVAADPAHQLFHTARLHANQARHAAAHREQDGPPTVMERQLSGMSVTQCADAVMEWARWAFLTSRMPLPGWTEPAGRHRLVEPWRELGGVARALGRPAASLSGSHAAFLDDLHAWHQLIEHRNEEAEEHLHRRLVALGLIDGRHSVTRILGAGLAAAVTAHTSQLFDWAAATTGLATPPNLTATRDGHQPPHHHAEPGTQHAPASWATRAISA